MTYFSFTHKVSNISAVPLFLKQNSLSNSDEILILKYCERSELRLFEFLHQRPPQKIKYVCLLGSNSEQAFHVMFFCLRCVFLVQQKQSYESNH